MEQELEASGVKSFFPCVCFTFSGGETAGFYVALVKPSMMEERQERVDKQQL